MLAQARPGAAGDAARAAAREALGTLAAQPLTYHGQLALEDLGQRLTLPAAPAPVQPAEAQAARQTPGLQRALALIALGLRSEGVREWNFTLRGLGDRELLAAAAWGCEREVWDRCINTSERSREQVAIAQRYPTPLAATVLAKTREVGVDPAYVYGLIRQESRFVLDARSSVGASGLMQLMPATARWTARRAGLVNFQPGQVNDIDTNVLLGTSYLKYALDDFDGAQALAAAAYNAGPNRPRRWREGPLLETPIWVENIPFNETRDYVKKVLANASVYSAVLAAQAATPGRAAPPEAGTSLRQRLGPTVGPRDARSAAEDSALPNSRTE
jgi:soluble lytic murein transglycosylase